MCDIVRKYMYKIENSENGRMKVVDSEGFAFSEATNVKGAVCGALAIGIRLSDIDFNGHYVPIKEVI